MGSWQKVVIWLNRLDCLTLEERTDRLYQNVGNPIYAALHPTTVKILTEILFLTNFNRCFWWEIPKLSCEDLFMSNSLIIFNSVRLFEGMLLYITWILPYYNECFKLPNISFFRVMYKHFSGRCVGRDQSQTPCSLIRLISPSWQLTRLSSWQHWLSQRMIAGICLQI